MSTLFNYGAPGKDGGWSDRNKYFEDKEIDGADFKATVKPRENPRVAVPSPFARFQIVQEAFGTVSGEIAGRTVDDRDTRLVSEVLDLMELMFEGGIETNHLEVAHIHLPELTSKLQEIGANSNGNLEGMRLLGSTLEDYAGHENFGFAENPDFYAIHHLGEPLALTSPTSGIIPTPNYKDWGNIQLNGNIPIFSKRRSLIERNEEFVLYLYGWAELMRENNGGNLPEPMRNLGTYLTAQKEMAPHGLKEKILKIGSLSNNSKYSELQFDAITPRIWGIPFFSISKEKVSNLIEEQSDLRLAPTVAGARHPLILTTNNAYSKMVYTSGQTYWDKRNPGFSYDDVELKASAISDRTVLPNGQAYNDGFLYEHDFLSDVLIQLPYKLDGGVFFDGGISRNGIVNYGFIPPIKETYFDFFTAKNLQENLKMVIHTIPGDIESVEKVEVLLDMPTTKGSSIKLKKVYYMADSLKSAIEATGVKATDRQAVGLIAPKCGVALNALPFNRAFSKNYYVFQLMADPFGLGEYHVSLNACVFQPEEHTDGRDIEDNFHKYVRRLEKGTPVLTNYVLSGGSFDYLKLTFTKGEEKASDEAHALLIPKYGLPEYRPEAGKALEFCFDFGTSNTFVAVKDDKGYLDFKLPTDAPLIVSTISPESRGIGDTTVDTFTEYTRQEFIPTFDRKLPFPISTVLATPKRPDESLSDKKLGSLPMLAASIPFIYGAEDFGSKDNKILSDLKWSYKKTNRKAGETIDYTASFINELMLLAQVLTMQCGGELRQCKVYWTYPLSMDQKMIRNLQSIWEESYGKFFEGNFEESEDRNSARDTNVKSFPESMAPMLFLFSKTGRLRGETTLSVDIGGGTCDLTIIPDGKIDKLKVSSIGFGANYIFGLKNPANEIPLFKLATLDIIDEIRKQAKRATDKAAYEEKAKELEKMLNEGRPAVEMSTYLFNLPNNPLFAKDMASKVSFNEWIKNHSFYHTVFLYYYAALIFYIAELWKNIKSDYKPTSIFFSGSGSKMLDIISLGNNSDLETYTNELFNLFAADKLDKEDLDEEISIKNAGSEPKQITAKGVLADVSGNSKVNSIKADMLEWKSAKDGKEYIKDYKMLDKADTTLTYGNLADDEVVDATMAKISDFHKKLTVFMEKHVEEFDDILPDMKEFFTELFPSEKRMRRAIRSGLEEVIDQAGEDGATSYPDVPFFEIVKNLISDAMIPQR